MTTSVRPRHPRPWLVLAIITLALPLQSSPAQMVRSPLKFHSSAESGVVPAAFSQRPLYFEENHGQSRSGVDFICRGADYAIEISGSRSVIHLSTPVTGTNPGEARGSARLGMELIGANHASRPVALEQLPGRIGYLLGSDSSAWHTDIPTFAKVRYHEVYRGIDVLYYGNQSRLEYDFVVTPEADPSVIVLRFTGLLRGNRGAAMRLAGNGDLVLHTATGEIRQPRPLVYQQIDGRRHVVDGEYRILGGGRVSFRLGRYDRSLPLVIDPVIEYATHLGGRFDERVADMAIDGSGNIWIAGYTVSPDFGANAPAPTPGGGSDTWLAKLDPVSGQLLLLLYLGGSADDECYDMKLDAAGNIYLAGGTFSPNFPTTPNAYKAAGRYTNDIFVTKLSPSGTPLYSTLFGGGRIDVAQTLVVNAAGRIYVAGYTLSDNMPTKNGFDATISGTSDMFIARFDPTASGEASLEYATYLGGSLFEYGNEMLLEGETVTIAGYASSKDLPVTIGAIGKSAGSADPEDYDAFLLKLNTAAGPAGLTYMSYLGGPGHERAIGMARHSSGDLFLTGFTISPSFPTTEGAYRRTLSNAFFPDIFVSRVRIEPSGASSLVYSTLMGGEEYEGAQGIAVEESGRAWIAGMTTSNLDFPLTPDALQPEYGGGSDMFIASFDPTGSRLLYSTYFGGGTYETLVPGDPAFGITLASDGTLVIAGTSSSGDMPVTPNARPIGGGYDAFVANSGSGRRAACRAPAPPPWRSLCRSPSSKGVVRHHSG